MNRDISNVNICGVDSGPVKGEGSGTVKDCPQSPQKVVLRVGWSLVRSSLRIKHSQRNHSEDAGWPENVANVQTFPPAGFICLFYKYSTKEVLFCFKFELLKCSHVGLLFTNE